MPLIPRAFEDQSYPEAIRIIPSRTVGFEDAVDNVPTGFTNKSEVLLQAIVVL